MCKLNVTNSDSLAASGVACSVLAGGKAGSFGGKSIQRYRGDPAETIRSVIMTVNVRMQPFDNGEFLEIFSANDIPLDEFGGKLLMDVGGWLVE